MVRCSAVVTLLIAAAVVARAEPAADPDREAAKAYRAKDYPAFLTSMRLVYARDPTLPRAIYYMAAAEALGGSPEEAIKLLHRLAATGLAFPIDREEDLHALPQRVAVRHRVALVRHADFPNTVRDCKIEGMPDDSVNTAIRVDLLLDGDLLVGVRTHPAACADVQPFGVLSKDDEVDVGGPAIFQRTEAFVEQPR